MIRNFNKHTVKHLTLIYKYLKTPKILIHKKVHRVCAKVSEFHSIYYVSWFRRNFNAYTYTYTLYIDWSSEIKWKYITRLDDMLDCRNDLLIGRTKRKFVRTNFVMFECNKTSFAHDGNSFGQMYTKPFKKFNQYIWTK